MSQYFANFYLDPLGRFVKEKLGVKAYVRYMDDFALWHNFRAELKELRKEVVSLIGRSRGST